MSLQSHAEVLNSLDSSPCLSLDRLCRSPGFGSSFKNGETDGSTEGKVFVASVSPQVRASLAATYRTTEEEAGWMIEQLLSGPQGLATGGRYGSRFAWVIDTNAMREADLALGAEEVLESLSRSQTLPEPSEQGSFEISPKTPILTSACPGWICYAEKTHPHVLPHLSRLKSPQALTGTLLKTVLSKILHINPDRIFHLAIMPCFDKKLEASREELTDIYWQPEPATHIASREALRVRDVDCVITAREVLMLAESRRLSFPSLPRKPLPSSHQVPFPDAKLNDFLFPRNQSRNREDVLHRQRRQPQTPAAGTSGGYLYQVLLTQQSLYPGSTIRTVRGRNADVVDYTLVHNEEVLFRAARYYGFRNIQNLVRKLKPMKKSRLPGGKMVGARKLTAEGGGGVGDYKYVEVMACPGGCTNGGGQIKIEDVGALQGLSFETGDDTGNEKKGQKEWLSMVDEAYYSMSSGDEGGENERMEEGEDSLKSDDEDASTQHDDNDDNDSILINGISPQHIKSVLAHWSHITTIDLKKLIYTSYRNVGNDAGGGGQVRETERMVEMASKVGGGW